LPNCSAGSGTAQVSSALASALDTKFSGLVEQLTNELCGFDILALMRPGDLNRRGDSDQPPFPSVLGSQ
jgi:hypothetical protein